MTGEVNTGLVVFRCLGRSDALSYNTLLALRSGKESVALQIALLRDAGDLSATNCESFMSLLDHVLFHKVPQGLGRTNRLAIAQARILEVDALVIIDGDGVYVEAADAVDAAIRSLNKFNVVVSRQSVVSLPLADRPGEDRCLYEDFERWLLERRFGCSLPHELQPGLYALDRQAIANIELKCRHFAADWEIAFRTLEAGLSIGTTEQEAKTRTQVSTSFREEHQREKFAELFHILELSGCDVNALVDAFPCASRVEYDPREIDKLRALCVAAFTHQ